LVPPTVLFRWFSINCLRRPNLPPEAVPPPDNPAESGLGHFACFSRASLGWLVISCHYQVPLGGISPGQPIFSVTCVLRLQATRLWMVLFRWSRASLKSFPLFGPLHFFPFVHPPPGERFQFPILPSKPLAFPFLRAQADSSSFYMGLFPPPV